MIHSIAEYQAFIGPNADYYISKWQAHAQTDFNFSALFTVFWFAYRKMYPTMFALMAAFFFLDLFSELFGMAAGMIKVGIFSGITVLISAAANKSYLKFANKKIAQLKAIYPDPPRLLPELAKAGGVSVGGIFIALLIIFCYIALVLTIILTLIHPELLPTELRTPDL